MNLRLLAHAPLVVLALGCATSPKPPPPAHDQQAAGSGCLPQTIEAYCATQKCPTYESEVSFAHQPRKNRFFYSIGTCGEHRFVQIQEGMGMGTDYFDANGKLVGTTSVADAQMCTGEFSHSIGVGGDGCTEQVVEKGGHLDE